MSAAGVVGAQSNVNLLCYICLETHSDPDKLNEIVICDMCGIMVHEVCYGIIDTAQTDDGPDSPGIASDDSIELWFCDECKSKRPPTMYTTQKSPPQVCELCPKTNAGPLKETEWSHWVHMVCALYTPSVQFYYTDTMSDITLSELDFHQWGSHPCAICSTSVKKYSGYTVRCFVSQCKHYYHVTCAQSHGLTCQSLDVKSPFKIYCPEHLSDQEFEMASHKKVLHKQMLSMIEEAAGRRNHSAHVVENLPSFQKRYEAQKKKWPKPAVPSERRSRPLHSNHTVVQKFNAKAVQVSNQVGMLQLRPYIPPEVSDSTISLQSILRKKDLLNKIICDYQNLCTKISHSRGVYRVAVMKESRLVKECLKVHTMQASLTERLSRAINAGHMDESLRHLTLNDVEKMIRDKAEVLSCNVCHMQSFRKLMVLCSKCQHQAFHFECIGRAQKLNDQVTCLQCRGETS